MSRYGDPNQSIERLQAEAHVSDQIIEDLNLALEDSERVCDRYREALVQIEQRLATEPNVHKLTGRISAICQDALWTRMKEAPSRGICGFEG